MPYGHRDHVPRLAFSLLFSLCFLMWPAICRLASAADDAGHPALELVADGLDRPVNVSAAADGTIFVAEQHAGRVRVIRDGRLLSEPFLDIADRLVTAPNVAQGLLGLALPPGFPGRPHIYVSYVSRDNTLVLGRFDLGPSADVADPDSESVILRIQAEHDLHYCGHIIFNRTDDMLYMCIGDNQPVRHTEPWAQDGGRLHGKIIRIDVEGGETPYAVPADNPFVGDPRIRDEIWAYGLRNPWQFSFDPATGRMFVPDVGRMAWEELNVGSTIDVAGANFGWPLAEGDECMSECSSENLAWPLYAYPHLEGCSIIGGQVYNGRRFPEWRGTYVFADYCSDGIWGLRWIGDRPVMRLVTTSKGGWSSVGADADGEILLTNVWDGELFRLHFPADDRRWIGLEEFAYPQMREALRQGATAARKRLDSIHASMRWRWTEPLARLRRFVSETLGVEFQPVRSRDPRR